MENKSTNKRRYYAVREGRKVGVFTKWSDAKQQIERFEGADYKVFDKIEHIVKLDLTTLDKKIPKC